MLWSLLLCHRVTRVVSRFFVRLVTHIISFQGSIRNTAATSSTCLSTFVCLCVVPLYQTVMSRLVTQLNSSRPHTGDEPPFATDVPTSMESQRFRVLSIRWPRTVCSVYHCVSRTAVASRKTENQRCPTHKNVATPLCRSLVVSTLERMFHPRWLAQLRRLKKSKSWQLMSCSVTVQRWQKLNLQFNPAASVTVSAWTNCDVPIAT